MILNTINLSDLLLKTLLFQRKDIYCILEEFVKIVKQSANVSNDNYDKISEKFELIDKQIKSIISGNEEFTFIPEDGSVGFNKLTDSLRNFLSSGLIRDISLIEKQNTWYLRFVFVNLSAGEEDRTIEVSLEPLVGYFKPKYSIDPDTNILTDSNTGKQYQLVLANNAKNPIWEDPIITEFAYEFSDNSSMFNNNGTNTARVKSLKFEQWYTTEYLDGSPSTRNKIEGSLNDTKGATFSFSNGILNSSLTIAEDGTITVGYSTTNADTVVGRIIPKVTCNNKSSNTDINVELKQAAASFSLSKTTVTASATGGKYDVTITKSNGVNIISANPTFDSNLVTFTQNKVSVTVPENTTYESRTIGTITVVSNIGSKVITVKQEAKSAKFYYGGASSVDSIPTDIEGLNETTDKTFSITCSLSNNYKLLFVNVPNGYELTRVEDRDHDPLDISANVITVGDRKIYYTEPGKGNLSNYFTYIING